jgi:hypothetical protein
VVEQPFQGRWRQVAAVALTGCLVLAGCSEEAPPSDDGTVAAQPTEKGELPELDIPGDPLVLLGTTEDDPVQRGTANVDIAVSDTDGGQVLTTEGRAEETAFDFPDFQPEGAYPRAIIIVQNPVGSQDDSLSPNFDSFSYGVDFSLDAESVGRPEDNGNNMLQRGLSSDPVMFKVDLDANLRPGCTVKGRSGTLIVHTATPIDPERWYRVRCEREGDRLQVKVTEYLASGRVLNNDRAVSGPVGAVSFDDPRIPVSVGGKVARDGAVILSETDQFNGKIANPFVLVGSP